MVMTEQQYSEQIRRIAKMICRNLLEQNGFAGWNRILSAIAQALGATAGSYGARHRQGYPSGAYLLGSTMEDSAVSTFYEQFVREDDDASTRYLQLLSVVSPFHAFVVNDAMPTRLIVDGPLYNELLNPYGMSRVLALATPLNRDVFGSLAVYRETGSRAYHERDVRFVEEIAYYLYMGAKIDMHRRVDSLVAPVSQVPNDAVGKIFLNEYRKIEFIDARARELVEAMGATLSSSELHIRNGDVLPMQMLLDGEMPVNSHQKLSVIAMPTHEQVWSPFARAVPVVLFIVPSKVSDARRVPLKRIFHGQFRCTPRESEIAYLYCMRKTRGEIAAMLGNTEETVKTHLKNIFRKLKISSRQDLWDLAEKWNPHEK